MYEMPSNIGQYNFESIANVFYFGSKFATDKICDDEVRKRLLVAKKA